MPTFVAEERKKKKGEQWHKVPELGSHEADSFKEAEKLILDEMEIINSIDIAVTRDFNQQTFGPPRFNSFKFRIRKIL